MYVLLLQTKILLVKNFAVVVNDYPERFTVSVPSVVPTKVCVNCQLHLQNCAGNRLILDINVQVRQVAGKLEQFIVLNSCYVPSSLLKLVVVDIVERNMELIQSINCVVLYVSVFRYGLVLIRQFSNTTIKCKLTHDVSIWQESFVNNLTPTEAEFHKLTKVLLHGYFEHSPQ